MYEYTINGIHFTKDKEQKQVLVEVHLHDTDIVAEVQPRVLQELPLMARPILSCALNNNYHNLFLTDVKTWQLSPLLCHH